MSYAQARIRLVEGKNLGDDSKINFKVFKLKVKSFKN